MGLNIKNERVHDLARQAARVTGKSQTGAIEEALERLLREAGVDPAADVVERKVDALRAIAAEYQADPTHGKGPTRIEDLYDDATGLPR